VSHLILSRFKCRGCGQDLGLVIADGKRTALEVYMADGSKAVIRRGYVTCPVCNKKRSFVELPLSALRLGIVDSQEV